MGLSSAIQLFTLREQKARIKTMTITIDVVVCKEIDVNVNVVIEVMGINVLAKAGGVGIDLLFVNKAMGNGLPVKVKVVGISLLSVAEVVVEVRLRHVKTLECFVSVLRQRRDDVLQRLRCFPVWARLSRGRNRCHG